MLSVALYYLSRSNYLLFHAIVEIYSVVIAAGIFFVSWNTRRHSENESLVFLGIAYAFIGLIDFFHVLSYEGMSIFSGNYFYANQLWICARMLESASLLFFVVTGIRKIKIRFPLVFVFFTVVTSLSFLSVFVWRNFPVCFIEGEGQTLFKITAEYVISFILVVSLSIIVLKRSIYDRTLFIQISLSIVFTIISEFCFTLYTDNYGITNVIGHIFKVLSFYLIYQSVIVNTLRRPFDILFVELKETQGILQAAMDQSPAGIAIARAQDGYLQYVNNAGLYMRDGQWRERGNDAVPKRYDEDWRIYSMNGLPLKKDEVPLFRAITSGEDNGSEFIIRRNDNEDVIVLANAAPVRNEKNEIISGIMVFQDITERKLADEKILSLLNEKKLILKEVHHRIKNNMNTIFSLLTLQADAQDNRTNKNILSDAAARVQSMMILYDKLYRSENENELSLREYFPSLINEIAGIFFQKSPVKIHTELDDIILPAKTISTLGIILNELITNSMKYAFNETVNGLIKVTATKKGNLIVITVEDNGSGISECVLSETTPGFGMQLVAMLVEQLNGSIAVERENGTRFILEFKV